MPLRVAFVRVGTGNTIQTLVVDSVGTLEELQKSFDRDIPPPEEKRTVIQFFSFEGEVGDALQKLLQEKGDEFQVGFERILQAISCWDPS